MFNYDKLPQEMKELKRFCLWKLENNTKIPINPFNGSGAKSNDSKTWSTFDIAFKNINRYNCNGVGFMLGDGYFGIDLDHLENNQKNPLAIEFIYLIQSYTEISQSGEGIHIICKGTLPKGRRRKNNIEMYDEKRFFALTGNVVDNLNTIIEATGLVKPLYDKYLGEEEKPLETLKNNVKQVDLEIDEILEKVQFSKNANLFNDLYNGIWEDKYPSQSEADMSFCSMLAFWTCKDKEKMDAIFRSSALYRDKWDILRGEKTYGEITIDNACKNCNIVYSGDSSIKKPTSNVYSLDDTGNAQRFVDTYGDNIKYNFDNKYWVIFNGKYWEKDLKQEVKNKADELIEIMKREVKRTQNEELQKELKKNVKRLSSSSGKEAMLKEAMHLGNIPATNSDFDKEIFYLNVKNGVLDLKNNKLMPHDKKYMQSKYIDIECDTKNDPKLWLKFLNDIFNEDKEMISYIQKAIGYTLTGSTKEQCFFQCYGEGANGKSVFLDIVYSLLGTYALNSQVDSILAKSNNSGGANSEIARMSGARFVRTNEPNEKSRFNEGLVKQLVGGDITTARFLYGQEFEFKPRFKLWIATNYKIEVRGTDGGIWRRMRLIPFKVIFTEEQQDKDLGDKLANELPQILGWAVKGCFKWQKEGLKMPKEVEKEVKEYKSEMDIIASFLKDNVSRRKKSKEKSTDVYKEFSRWAKEGNEFCMSQTRFGKEMGKRFEKKVIGGYTYYMGMCLKKNDNTIIYTRSEKENDTE